MLRLRTLKKRAEFLHAKAGRTFATKNIVVQCARPSKAKLADIGVGYTASKKVGSAVCRNKAKRRMREAVRQVLADRDEFVGCDLVMIARRGVLTCSFPELCQNLHQALGRHARHVKDV